MLNILLSALLDPDRRLRSFRRSERLASILVCSMLIAWLEAVSLLCKDFLFHTLMFETRVGSAWFKNAAAVASPFHNAPGLAGGHPGACNPSDVFASLGLWYFSSAGLCLVGFNPLNHLHWPQTLLRTEEVRLGMDWDCSDSGGRVAEVIGHISPFHPQKHV